jgi:hypothetical protein
VSRARDPHPGPGRKRNLDYSRTRQTGRLAKLLPSRLTNFLLWLFDSRLEVWFGV